MARPIAVSRLAQTLSAAARHYAASQNIEPTHLAFLPIRDTKNNYLYMKIGVDLPIDSWEWTRGIQQQFDQEFPAGAIFNLTVWEVEELADLYRHVSLDDELELVDLSDGEAVL